MFLYECVYNSSWKESELCLKLSRCCWTKKSILLRAVQYVSIFMLPATKHSLLDIPGLFHTIHTRFVPCGQLIGPEGTPYRTLIHKVHDLCKGNSELREELRGIKHTFLYAVQMPSRQSRHQSGRWPGDKTVTQQFCVWVYVCMYLCSSGIAKIIW